MLAGAPKKTLTDLQLKWRCGCIVASWEKEMRDKEYVHYFQRSIVGVARTMPHDDDDDYVTDCCVCHKKGFNFQSCQALFSL